MIDNNVKKNILVLDDNRNDLMLVKFVIMRMGCNPILIEQPSALIENLQKYQISLIVLDLDMPGLTGIDVLKKIKKVPSYKDIPIVMLTGNSEMSNVKTTIALGAVDYIVKPIDPMIFEGKVKKFLHSQTLEQKNSWVEYEIKKLTDKEIKLHLSAKIVSIGEMTLTIQLNQELPAGFSFYSDAPLFAELEIKNPLLKVETCHFENESYFVKCSMIGLKEAELKKIRLYSQLLVGKEAV